MNEHGLYILRNIITDLAYIGVIITIIITVLKNNKGASNNTNKTKHQVLERDYYNSTYFLATKNEYSAMLNNKGLYGEYKIFKTLQAFEEYGTKYGRRGYTKGHEIE